MYNNIIKKIRLEKGMKQKEVYANVVSKSFYSDFEAGKCSIEVSKFFGLIKNLGLSYKEFENYEEINKIDLDNKVNTLYKQGNFNELHDFYLENYNSSQVSLRYIAIKAYLLILITQKNFYTLSRSPFNEITNEIENYKTWTLREISLAKLILLSFNESDKDKATALFNRIEKELNKYKELDSTVYFEELCDVLFNRVQSLLIINRIDEARELGHRYKKISNQSDSLYLILQQTFIDMLIGLYTDFPTYIDNITSFIEHLSLENSSEFNFYKIIITIHKGKAENYYNRYIKKDTSTN